MDVSTLVPRKQRRAPFTEEDQIIERENEVSEHVMECYTLAGEVTMNVLQQIRRAAIDKRNGISVAGLCILGDKLVNKYVEASGNRVAEGSERGICEPTSVNISPIVRGDSRGKVTIEAEEKQPTYIKEGELCNISVGCQVDGFATIAAYPLYVPLSDTDPTLGPIADAVCAAHLAMEACIKALGVATYKRSVSHTDLRTIVDEAAKSFHVQVVDGSYIRRIRRFLIGQNPYIEDPSLAGAKVVAWPPSNVDNDLAIAITHPQFPLEVDPGDAYIIDLAFTSAETGRTPYEEENGVVVRDVGMTYEPKLKVSRTLLQEDLQSVFPLTVRSLERRGARMAVTELLQHDILIAKSTQGVKRSTAQPAPAVARRCATVLKSADGRIEVMAGGGSKMPIPWVKSIYEANDVLFRLLNETVDILQVGSIEEGDNNSMTID